MALAVRGWLSRHVPAAGTSLASWVATRGTLAILIAAAGIYLHHHIRVAGGLDSYGYLSAAHLLAAGRLSEPQPLATLLPFEHAMNAAAPLGNVPSANGDAAVPRFPLGLPIVMAMFTIFGATGPFFAPLVMGYAAIALAYLLGRRAGPTSTSHTAGLLAATLLAVDPLFAASAIQPMSDVPATCWVLGAVWAVLNMRTAHRPMFWSVGGGICAGMALLTRPVLLPAVIVLVLVANDWNRMRSTLALGATVAAFIALQLALNAALYGGFTASGYGSASHMFELSISRLSANVRTFGQWLTYSHTAFFWILWPGALVVLRRHKQAWHMSAVAAAAAAPYGFYIVFDDWEASRFVLPSIAIVLILAASAVVTVLRTAGQAWQAAVVMVALGCAAASHAFLEREGIYNLATQEMKYQLVGEWFKTNTSERAVVLAALHSGTIRLYGHRPTIRWDHIPERSLTPTLRKLVDAGYEPYLALDLPTEPPMFAARFSAEPVNTEQVARVRVVNIYKFVSAH